MAQRMFSSEGKAKLTQLMNEGISVMTEVQTLQEGLNETIKAVAEELEIKPAILKKQFELHKRANSLILIVITKN